MHVKDSDIKQFQEIFSRRFGKHIGSDAARRKLLSLVELVYETYQPVTHEQLTRLWGKDEYEDKNNEQSRATNNF
jgi:hypothetical protein